MRSNTLFYTLPGGIAVITAVFISQLNPVVISTLFDILTFLSTILTIALYSRKAFHREAGIITLIFVMYGLTIYLHCAYDIPLLDLKHMQRVAMGTFLGIVFASFYWFFGKRYNKRNALYEG